MNINEIVAATLRIELVLNGLDIGLDNGLNLVKCSHRARQFALSERDLSLIFAEKSKGKSETIFA